MILPYIGLFLVFGCYCCYAEELCYSDVCKKYVKFVQENIDETVDPCENFYQFSCGNFLRNQHLGSNENRIGTADLVDKQNKEKLSELLSQDVAETDNRWVKNAKKLYASCINLDRVDKNTEPYMRDILKDLGGWPLVTGVENPREPVDLLKRIMKYGLLNFVDIGIGINPKKPDERIIKIQQPDSISYDYFVLDGYVEAYKSFLKAITGLLNPNNTINNDKDIDEMLELSKSFVKIQLTPAELSLTNSNNIEMELGVLEKTFPGFPFVEVVKSMFEEIHDVVINESEPISVDNWEYFEKMHSIFAEAIEKKPNVVKNYMLGNFFSGLLNDLLPEKYLNAKLILKKVLSGVTSLEPRNLFCVRTAQTLLPDEVGKIYASAFLGKEAKEEAIHMSSDILNQTLDIIKDADWMDTNSKAKAIDKATNIKLQVGYPDFYDNLTYIESSKQYTLNSDNLLENLITLLKYSRREEYSNLRKKVDDATGWLLSPSIMNAIYTFANNNIYVLAGILTPPFYNYKLPKYINYGSMGFTYGHEVTHAFDITGRRYDKNGKYFPDNEEGLWTFKTIEKFTEKVQCMIEQYSEFHDKEFNITVNGLLTLGENIADNGGMKAAFEAYKKLNLKDEPRLSGLEKYTQDQMFFIAFGQSWCELYKPEAKKEMMLDNVHTIEEFRVEGVVRNSDYFREAFKCDDKNRTYKRCSVW